MASYFSGLFLCAFIFCPSTSVFLTPSGNVNVCLGEMRTFTCVSGAVLVWEYDGASNALFTSTDNTTRSLSSDIDVEFVSNAGGVLQVMAIVNVTSDINGKTLQCRNTALDTSNTESRNIIFNAQNTLATTRVNGKAIKLNSSKVSIDVSWQEATCANMYEVVITRKNGVLELTTTTEGTSFVYNVPSNVHDCYTFSVYSIGFVGMRKGGPFTEVDVRFFESAEVINIMNNLAILTISIQAIPTVCQQSSFISCSILLTNSTFRDETSSCPGMFDVTIGGTYNYTVTVTNFLGNSSISNITNITGTLQTTRVPMPTIINEPQDAFPPESIGVIVPLGIYSLVMTVLFGVALLWGKKRGTNAVVGKDISLVGKERSESPDEKQTEM